VYNIGIHKEKEMHIIFNLDQKTVEIIGDKRPTIENMETFDRAVERARAMLIESGLNLKAKKIIKKKIPLNS
jgi:hypothetical protein